MAFNPLEEAQKFLGDMRFPSHKNDIVQHAEQRGASSNVLDTLRALPERQYHSVTDITKEIGGSLQGKLRQIL